MPGYSCIYLFCSSRDGCENKKSLFRCPKDRQRSAIWLKAAGREDLLEKNFTNYKLCEDHFVQGFLYSTSSGRRLLPDAVPTIFCGPPKIDEAAVQVVNLIVNKRRRQNNDSYEDDSTTTDSSKPIQMPIDDVVGLTDVKCELDENMSDSDSLMEIVKHEIEDYIPDVPDSVSPQEIEAILINDDADDVDTVSPQNIELIKTKEEPKDKNYFDDRHPVDVFCKSVALSLKSLRSDLCNEGKIRIIQLISELEQRNALPNENPSTSRSINNRAEPTSTITRNLILKKELD